jgi:hypothetical protein
MAGKGAALAAVLLLLLLALPVLRTGAAAVLCGTLSLLHHLTWTACEPYQLINVSTCWQRLASCRVQ